MRVPRGATPPFSLRLKESAPPSFPINRWGPSSLSWKVDLGGGKKAKKGKVN